MSDLQHNDFNPFCGEYSIRSVRPGRLLTALVLTAILAVCSCTKTELDDYDATLTPYQTYLPAQARATHYYNLDSVVPTPFGAALDTVHYTLKDSLSDPQISDKDTTYTVYRYITPGRNHATGYPWTYQLSYRLVYSPHQVTKIDNHGRRFILLTNPIRDAYSWEGNRAFTSDLNPGDFYYGWQYTYELSGSDILTIHQVDQTNGNPGDFDPSLYQERLYAYMEFQRGVGLVSQQELHITYQANQNNPNAFGYYEQDSYAITVSRITTRPLD